LRRSWEKNKESLPIFVTDITIQLYDSLGDPVDRFDERTVTLCEGDFYIQATTGINLGNLFELFSAPFEYGKTKVRAFIFAELIFGCPNYTLVFALPLQLAPSLPSPPLLVTSLKTEILTNIFSFLPISEISNFSSVSQNWYHWIKCNEKLWKKKHDEIWEISPLKVLHEVIGWHLVVVLKKKKRGDTQKRNL